MAHSLVMVHSKHRRRIRTCGLRLSAPTAAFADGLRRKDFLEMEPAQPRPDSVVARHLGNVLADEPIPGATIERDRGFLYRGGAEHQARDAAAAAFRFGTFEHPATDAGAAVRGI